MKISNHVKLKVKHYYFNQKIFKTIVKKVHIPDLSLINNIDGKIIIF